mmetsp:Transcript_9360/g.24193  ORF Transcript_9360/g.24193 Transcript_9360/m.24193 type:complete len:245 (-) Transcript_9360:404-1138(-)
MSNRPRASSSVWVPRAVKQVERAQQAGAQLASAPPSGAGVARTSDLDDLDDNSDGAAPPDAKRARLATAATESPAAEPGADSPDPAQRREALEEEVISGGPRLAQHIKAPAKCIKVAAMAYSLLEQGAVTPRNCSAFFCVLEAAMEEPMRPVREPKFRVAYRRLFDEAAKHRHVFSAEHQVQLDAWLFMLHACLELVQADESYSFNRTTKRVRARPRLAAPSLAEALPQRSMVLPPALLRAAGA